MRTNKAQRYKSRDAVSTEIPKILAPAARRMYLILCHTGVRYGTNALLYQTPGFYLISNWTAK